MISDKKYYYKDGTTSTEFNKNKILRANKYYYKDGTTSAKLNHNKILHRTDGPAEERADGTKCWYIDDKLHRIDGPAIEGSDGAKTWYINDKLHRTDGPAIEYANAAKCWLIDGKYYYKEDEFNQIISEVKALDPILQLTDPRWWVRELAIKNLKR